MMNEDPKYLKMGAGESSTGVVQPLEGGGAHVPRPQLSPGRGHSGQPGGRSPRG